jgi:hypothetical protein
MGLFSTLLLNTTAATAHRDVGDSSSTPSNVHHPTSIPTVVQLYTARPVAVVAIDTAAVATDVLENEKHPTKTAFKKYHTHTWLMPPTLNQSSSFAPLRYSAVQCLPESALEKMAQLSSVGSATAGGLRNQSRLIQEMAHQWIPPDLGLWYCRCDGGTMTDALLPRTMTHRESVYAMVVDMTEPNLVESHVTIMQQTLLRFLIQHAAEFRNASSPVATTSLAQVRAVQFGLANQEEDVKHTAAAEQEASSSLLEKEAEIRLALHICVLWPSTAATDPSGAEDANASHRLDYKTQQHLQLLMYHIRKYAAALNATLIFLEEEEDTATTQLDHASRPTSSTQQPTVSRRELPFLWKDLASGVAIWRSTEEDELPAAEKETAGFSRIYGPDHHQEDLNESVLLRHASYPGHWDATQDSVWNILPPPRPRAAAAPPLPPGDAAWCQELYESMAGPPPTGWQSPAPSQKGPASAAKTPNDAAVSSFFEGLLK